MDRGVAAGGRSPTTRRRDHGSGDVLGERLMSSFFPYTAVRETHSGVVVLIGDRALKVKKPVDLGFLDFRSRASRETACRREVELNRRLAPDVYRGVATFPDVDGGAGEPVVVMRRMPDERRLTTLVQAGQPLGDVMVRLARMVAALHAAARRAPEIAAEGRRDSVRDRWLASFRQVTPFHGTVLDPAVAIEIERLACEFLAGRGALFERRVADGRIVDGHGDLICDDIFCLPDGPRVLDCLEFDDRLRYLDGLDDIAFLAMDLEHLGAGELAGMLLDRYAGFAGDPAPPSLRHHYIAYRSFVRAKINCIGHAQGDSAAAETARAYAALTLRHLWAGAVRLILVGGLPAAGKSTVAGLVADQLGAVLLSTDHLRKEMAGISALSTAADGYRHGIYDRDHTERTYVELLHRAGKLLGVGESVVLDASWTHARFRALASGAATRTQAQLCCAECWVPSAVRRSRLTARRDGASDADQQVAARMAADADPWPHAVRLCTTGSPATALQQLWPRVGVTDGAVPD